MDLASYLPIKQKCKTNLKKAWKRAAAARLVDVLHVGITTRTSSPNFQVREPDFESFARDLHANAVQPADMQTYTRKCPHCECPFGPPTASVQKLVKNFTEGLDVKKTPYTVCGACQTLSCDICGEISADHVAWVRKSTDAFALERDFCRNMLQRRKDQEAQRLIDEETANKNVPHCPTCPLFVYKISGCNHMTCKCGQHFCYVCGDALLLDGVTDHYNKTKNPKKCKQFDELEEPAEDGEEDVAGLPLADRWPIVDRQHDIMIARELQRENELQVQQAIAESLRDPDLDRAIAASLQTPEEDHAFITAAQESLQQETENLAQHFDSDPGYRNYLFRTQSFNTNESLQQYLSTIE
jgi:hypothetical protein